MLNNFNKELDQWKILFGTHTFNVLRDLTKNAEYPPPTCFVIFIGRSPSEVFLRKGILKMCSEFTGEHPCRRVTSIKLHCNFIEIALRHGCSPVNLLYIFRTLFPKNTSAWLLLFYFSRLLVLVKFLESIYIQKSKTSIL